MMPRYFALEFAGSDLDLKLNAELLRAVEEGQRLLQAEFADLGPQLDFRKPTGDWSDWA